MRTITLVVPSPAEPRRLDRFLCAQLHGLSRRKVKGLLDAGQVRLGSRPERKAGRDLSPGDEITVDLRPSLLPCPALGEDHILTRADGWLVLDKPPGLPTHRPSDAVPGVPEQLAPLLRCDVEGVRPAHRLDRATSGALLVALDDESASYLSQAFEQGRVIKRYIAIVSPSPSMEEGHRTDEDPSGPMELSWRVIRRSRDGSRAELEVRPVQGRTHQIRRQLAAAGTPIVGDLLHGVALAGGSPRMGLHCAELTWDDERATAPVPAGWDNLLDPGHAEDRTERTARRPHPRATSSRLRRLQVSRATARVMAGGHPWVLPDRHTGDLAGFRAGDQALLVDPSGKALGVAVVDPEHSVVARLLDPRADAALPARWFADATRRALRRRKPTLARADTTCGRLVNAENDGLPGLTVDHWGDALVLTRATAAVASYSPAVVEVLRENFPESRIYEKDHIIDLRRRGQGREGDVLPGRWLRGGAQPTDRVLLVKEAGLSFHVEPFEALTTGFYPDQRDNRDRMAERITAESRVANLFAHTGAFSVRAAAEGARRAVTVDLSPRYTRWAEENLRRNGLDPAVHPVVTDAVDRWLEQTEERFDGVIVDPPAFARPRGGGRGWNAKRDYQGLVQAVGNVLAPGPSWLLCIINLKGIKPAWLREQIERGLRRAGRRVRSFTSAPPSPDFPSRRGFPEGRPFVGVFVDVEASEKW